MSTQNEQNEMGAEMETDAGAAKIKLEAEYRVIDGRVLVDLGPDSLRILRTAPLVWSKSTGKSASPVTLDVPVLKLGDRRYNVPINVNTATAPDKALDAETGEEITAKEAAIRAAARKAAGKGAGRREVSLG